MYRMIRSVAAMVLASFAFQGTVVIAHSNAPKPPKITVAKPTSPKAPKSVKAPIMKTATSIKPVKPVKATTTRTTMKSTKPAAKADVKLTKTIAKADGKLAKSTVKADAKSTTSSSRKSSTTSPGDTTTPPTLVVSNPVADKISRNSKLAAKIEARLPAGMTLAQASTGFRNQGQFMAAVNVSRNLGIDFVKLQTSMTGQTVAVDPTTHAITTTPTGVAPLSLGQSIQKLKPGVDADAAAATAQAQTSAMVQTTSTTTATTTASKSKKTHGN